MIYNVSVYVPRLYFDIILLIFNELRGHLKLNGKKFILILTEVNTYYIKINVLTLFIFVKHSQIIVHVMYTCF